MIEKELSSTVLQMNNLQFSWSEQDEPVLDIPEWQVKANESWCIFGPSGCGKSTLLNLITGVLQPQRGSVTMVGQVLNEQSMKNLDRLRAEHIGYIYQQFNLLPYLSPIQNVLMPLKLSKARRLRSSKSFETLEQEAKHWLTALGLPDSHWDKSVLQLSLGQQQRVAAARALMGGPELIVADEPTSALDPENANRFIETLKKACDEQKSALILVSHDPTLQSHFDHVWSLADQEFRKGDAAC